MHAARAIPAGLGLLALLGACGGDAPAPGPGTAPTGAADGALPAGWIGEIVGEPERFAAVVETPEREGWVALHGGDLAAAAATADPVLQARAWEEQARFHQDLGHLSAWTWAALADAWIAQDPTLAQGPLPLLAALAVADAGDADGARKRAAALSPPQQQLVEAVLVPVVRRGDAPPPPPGGVPGATLDGEGCVAAHLDLRAGRLQDLPAPCADGGPLALPGDRTFQDPLIHGARAHLAAGAVRAARGGGSWTEALAEGPVLPHLLFGEWWAEADLRAALAGQGAPGPSLAALDLPEAGQADDPQAALERARALDAALDAWAAGQRDAADEDGRALLDHLRLVEQVRARTLIRWSRAALRDDRPRQALAWLQLAHDADDPRSVGAVNRPSLFALLAEARARTGRTREALDALAPLVDAWPQVRGLSETLGDLVVLQNMGRQGDSKEL